VIPLILAALVGLVWAAQGLGAPIGGSFMVGDLRWTVAGLVLMLVAGVLLWRRLRRSS
jgi:glucose dehydrogenase